MILKGDNDLTNQQIINLVNRCNEMQAIIKILIESVADLSQQVEILSSTSPVVQNL